MKWEDIKKIYKDEWVLIKVDKVDDNFNLLEGEVLASSRDENEVYKKLLEMKPREFMIEYTGVIPEDLAVVLFKGPYR
jgi:hypothetical protein